MTKAMNPLATTLFRMAWKSSSTIFRGTKYHISKRLSSSESAGEEGESYNSSNG